ncbi:MAG: PepSY domain-containing protein [Porticoccaceae bacterium]|nr:PepSY domain-containing protein [Porticoccaceae bacterium]
MSINWNKFNRKTHYWGSIICAIPVLIIIVTGTILLLKKEISWIQPATMRGLASTPRVSFDDILGASMAVKQAEIGGWDDITRLDVRPAKGIVKVRAVNQWEIQLDHNTLAVLQVAYRRSGLIEALHDGTFFHGGAKLTVFLPAALILLVLWISGLYLFIKTMAAKGAKKRRQKQAGCVDSVL